jgi:hypothetical protein
VSGEKTSPTIGLFSDVFNVSLDVVYEKFYGWAKYS